MNDEFKFSIILIFENSEKYIKNCINSLLKQTISFKEDVQLIFVDNNSEDLSRYIALDYSRKYPKNMIFLDNLSGNIIDARKIALKNATGKYINFIHPYDFISKNTLKNVYTLFEKEFEKEYKKESVVGLEDESEDEIVNGYDDVYKYESENETVTEFETIDIVTVPVKYTGLENRYSKLYDKFEKDTIIDFEESYKLPLTLLESLYFKQEQINEISNLLDDESSEDAFLVNKILLKYKKIGLGNGVVYYRKNYERMREHENIINDTYYYTQRLEDVHLNLIKYSSDNHGDVPDFIQFFLIHDLKNIIELPQIPVEIDENLFYEKISEILSYVKAEIILEYNYISSIVQSFFIYLKNKRVKNFVIEPNNLILKTNDYILDEFKEITFNIYNVEEHEEYLEFNFNFNTYFSQALLDVKIHLECENMNKVIDCEYNPDNSHRFSYLLNNWYYYHDYNVKVPIYPSCNSKITFCLKYDMADNETLTNPEIIVQDTIISNLNTFLNKDYKLMIKANKTQLDLVKYDLMNVLEGECYKFTIIIPVFNSEKYLNMAVDSVLNQTLTFTDNVQIILVDDGSQDSSYDIIKYYVDKYPENIMGIKFVNNLGQSYARNIGLLYVKGEYVNFLDSDDYLSENTLGEVYSFFANNYEKIDLVSIPMYYVDSIEKEHELNYKYTKDRIIKLNKTPNNIQLSISSTFIKSEVFEELNFNINLKKSEDSLLVNQILLKKNRYGVVVTPKYYYRKRFDNTGISDTYLQYKDNYTNRMKYFHKNLIDYCMDKYKKVPNYIQFMLVSDLQEIIKVNDLSIFESESELDEFWNYFKNNSPTGNILKHISSKAILKNRNIYSPMKSFLMYLKNGQYKIIKNRKGRIFLKSKKYTIDRLNNHKIWLDIIDFRKDNLILSGHMVSNFASESLKFKLVDRQGMEYYCEYIEYSQPERQNISFLSIPWRYDYNFNISISLENVYDTDFHFEVQFNEGDLESVFTPGIGFRVPSGLTEFNTYFVKHSRIIYYRGKKIFIIPYSYRLMLKHERYDLHLIRTDKQEGYLYIIYIRILYMILYPFMKNIRIWTINDRINNVDENGMHLFKYLSKQDDGIRKYYIISKDCEEYETLKKQYKNLLIHGSFKHKLIYLFSEKTISAFLNESFFNPFWIEGNYNYRKIYCNLITTDRYFLQHGVISCDLTNHIKRYKYNLALIVTSADAERQSFFDLKYNYPTTVVQALGLPRYDNLTSDKSKKQIVFLPTWRSYLDKDESLFIHSDYYHTLNNLLNNQKLHQLLNKYSYEFVFKPHPELIKHLDSFDKNESYKISVNESFQDIFRDSSLLISDFSSVVFDFSYLKKPIIYYQPNDDYHFDEAYFDYDTMGFGEVVKDEDDLINLIEQYLINDCQMDDKYKQRVETFFKYNDKNNCKRVYEWILEN